MIGYIVLTKTGIALSSKEIKSTENAASFPVTVLTGISRE